MSNIQVNDDIEIVVDTAKDLCGIDLNTSKAYLIESRLGPLVEENGLTSYAELCALARDVAQSALRSEFISRITTHETLFFRDKNVFSALQHKILPELFDAADQRGSRSVRVWSAACSTGQEPYSVAMLAQDLLERAGRQFQVEICATDVSEPTVRAAMSGVYRDYELNRCSMPGIVERYSVKEGDGRRISPSIHSMCRFTPLDLQRDFSLLGTFDLVLCRNVLIYFDQDLRRDVLSRIAKRMTQGSRLVVGSTENLIDVDDTFESEQHCGATFYRVK